MTVELTTSQEMLLVTISLLYNTVYLAAQHIVQVQKIYILPHKSKWNFLGMRGAVKPKDFKNI